MRGLFVLLTLLLPLAAAQEDNRSGNVTTTQAVDSCGKVRGAYCTPGPGAAVVVAAVVVGTLLTARARGRGPA